MLKYKTIYYQDVANIADAVFETLGCADSFYFEKPFLFAFAKANPTLQNHYLVIYDNKQAIALALVQQLAFMVDNSLDKNAIYNRVAHSLQQYLNRKQVQLSICGNIFLSGNYGVFIKQGISTVLVYEQIVKEIKHLPSDKPASVFLVKDFTAKESMEIQSIKNYQYQALDMEPNMLLKLDWPDFDTYKKALRSKYRIKINKTDSQSQDLIVRPFKAKDIREHLQLLQKLYCNITDIANFALLDLNVETYAFLKESFRESVIINTYWHIDKMVGFSAAFKVKDTLTAHYIGLDYSLNKELAIYRRILNDYVRLGFELGCKEVNLGRTSSEIKSTLGATPEPLSCYIRHRRTFTNMLFKPLVRKIKMTEYKQHQPFKKV